MEDWKERLRDLYLVENDDISSPNSIEFNWGSFLFKRKTSEPAHFYLATQDSIEEFIFQELSKAREEGFRNCYKEVLTMDRFSERMDMSRKESFRRLKNLLEEKLVSKLN